MKLFHVPPPVGGDEAAWADWLKADDRARAVAKAVETRAQEFGDPLVSGLPGFIPTATKSGGVHRQTNLVGFSGDFEAGDGTLEPAVMPAQEEEVDAMRQPQRKRGTPGSKRSSGAKRAKAKKAAKKAAILAAKAASGLAKANPTKKTIRAARAAWMVANKMK